MKEMSKPASLSPKLLDKDDRVSQVSDHRRAEISGRSGSHPSHGGMMPRRGAKTGSMMEDKTP